MAELRATIEAAGTALEEWSTGGPAEEVTRELENAGAQVGRLQIGCCAPTRLPLYSRILLDLTNVQLTLDRSQGDMSH